MYSDIEPYHTGTLKVSTIHELYYEIAGNKDGNPVIFLHGGPGSGCSPKARSFFNPDKYKVVLFDQRGSGRSTPLASLEENTTWDSVKDIETLRTHLGITKWHVFGGSWGSSLGLIYAQTHPDRVKTLVLRGIFALRRSELDFFYKEGGTSHFFPEGWEAFIAPIPEAERGDMILAYQSRLNSPDEATRLAAGQAWAKWEFSVSKLQVEPEDLARLEDDVFASSFARVENHYFVNGGFIRDGQMLEEQEIAKIRHIPTVMVNGRYDMLCTPSTAYTFKKLWPEIELYITPAAGHSANETSTIQRLIEATDKFADL